METRDFKQVAQSWLDGNYDEETKKQVVRADYAA